MGRGAGEDTGAPPSIEVPLSRHSMGVPAHPDLPRVPPPSMGAGTPQDPRVGVARRDGWVAQEGDAGSRRGVARPSAPGGGIPGASCHPHPLTPSRPGTPPAPTAPAPWPPCPAGPWPLPPSSLPPSQHQWQGGCWHPGRVWGSLQGRPAPPRTPSSPLCAPLRTLLAQQPTSDPPSSPKAPPVASRTVEHLLLLTAGQDSPRTAVLCSEPPRSPLAPQHLSRGVSFCPLSLFQPLGCELQCRYSFQ